MKSYHELKKKGRLTKECYRSIETCLRIGVGIDKEKEKVSYDEGHDESTGINKVILPKMG